MDNRLDGDDYRQYVALRLFDKFDSMNFPNVYTLFRRQTARYRGAPIFYSRAVSEPSAVAGGLNADNRDAKVYPSATADGSDRNKNYWKSTNWEDFEQQVHDFACALLAKGLSKGASVAILAGNVPEWTIVDIATIAAGGVGVGIYPTSSPEQCEYIINHSDAQFVFVDSQKQLEKVLQVRERLPQVKEIIVLEKRNEAEARASARAENLLENENSASILTTNQKESAFEDFLKFGKQNREKFLPQIEETGYGARAEDTAIMVYTSGTTGNPKGAMLSHKYILNSCESLRRSVPVFDTDVSFSYLPGCHVAERISGIYNRLYNGASVYFVDDLARLYAYMLEVKPTVFASLPRFFEKVYARVVSEVQNLPLREREEFEKSLNVGRGIVRLQMAKEEISDDLKERFADVSPNFQRVRDAFGGNIRLATSGGAPLPNEIAEFFASAGLPILQAYGLTENICVAFNRADDFKFGTVGKPMPMCEVKIAPDGEILVKSPMMFSGYYKEPEKTAQMFDAEGWLKTGDLGALDEDGFLKITGRKKEIIVLSTGKNVAPALLENLLKENHLISQAFIYGDGRSYLTALITLNQIEAEAYARAHNVAFSDFADLTGKEEIRAIVAAQIDKTNARVASSEQIKKFVILERDFSPDLDEVTPTLKIKRAVVAERFQDVLQGLY
ncbi:MAG TPA: long-chain fatty acid--CoA ligase [Pyrinomonadaceae bacterium]